ncbi:MAG: hypothetical protein BV456_06115 [Thermoplasmata archaeon M8B2D]|nr:MAG: hypothetical protein BV456_06115 [Thermoplasmata archaeon M8B2D]
MNEIEKALEELEALRLYAMLPYDGYETTLETIETSIKALEEKKNNRWIPVNEKLPKIYEDTNTSEIVFVQGYDKEADYEWQAMGWYAEEPKQWFFAECKSTDKPIDWINIIAWQPLPEPYKEG